MGDAKREAMSGLTTEGGTV